MVYNNVCVNLFEKSAFIIKSYIFNIYNSNELHNFPWIWFYLNSLTSLYSNSAENAASTCHFN